MAGGPLLLSRIDRGAWQFAAMTFLFGAALGLAVGFGAVALSNPDSDSHVRTVVDFHFQMLNISTPRQADKLMNIFVKWRYPPGTDRCPFHPTDNHCIQYQHAPMEWIRNVTQSEQEGLVLGAEWERVALLICRHLYDHYTVAAVSVLVQVNGDGRSWVEAYEPGAHGSTCTIGPSDFLPIERPNTLPSFADGDDGPGRPR